MSRFRAIVYLCVAHVCLNKIARAEKLVLAQDDNYPPYAYRDASTGKLTGFGRDIADGMTAMCDNLEIEVVGVKWSDCWLDENGGRLGRLLEDGNVDACISYTHQRGIRNQYAEYSYGILEVNRAAGLLTVLENGQPKVTGQDDLTGKKVVDVAGWAPAADTLGFVRNQCTGEKFSDDHILLTGDGLDESLSMLLDGTADAMYVMADQAYKYQCNEGITTPSWNCSLWEGFGTKFAYVQTGQFGYMINGTTLAMAKKGSGVAAMLNPCLARFMQTKEYYDICQQYGLSDTCYRNNFFSTNQEVPEYNKPTKDHTGNCSSGYCPCRDDGFASGTPLSADVSATMDMSTLALVALIGAVLVSCVFCTCYCWKYRRRKAGAVKSKGLLAALKESLEIVSLKGHHVYRREQSLKLGVSAEYIVGIFHGEARTATGLDDPNFHQIAERLFYGANAKGFGKVCPRDRRLNCSFVDALAMEQFKKSEKHASKATVFLSWVWSYKLSLFVSGIQNWLKNQTIQQSAEFVWCCAMCNNQFRIFEEKFSSGADDNLENIFGERLKRTGRMIALWDTWSNPEYLTRVWCIYEQFTAISLNVEISVVLPAEQAEEFQQLIGQPDFLTRVKNAFRRIDCRHAKASVPADERKVKEIIRNGVGFHDVDRRVLESLNLWFSNCFQQHLQQTAKEVRTDSKESSASESLSTS